MMPSDNRSFSISREPWVGLARSYEFIESLEHSPGTRKNAMTDRATIQVETPDTMECRDCSETMRLFGIEAHPTIGRTVLKTYVCPCCDGVQTRVAPAPAGKRGRPANGLALENTFDAEATFLLGNAFDAAWEAVLGSGSPPVDAKHADAIREALAKHIIEMMRHGERNPRRLAENALQLVLGWRWSA
jgi:hypothetical protein